MRSRDEWCRELWTREVYTEELGVMWDDVEDVIKGDGGNAGLGVVCCVDREEERSHGKRGRFTVTDARR